MFFKSLVAYMCENVTFTFDIPMWCILITVILFALKLLGF